MRATAPASFHIRLRSTDDAIRDIAVGANVNEWAPLGGFWIRMHCGRGRGTTSLSPRLPIRKRGVCCRAPDLACWRTSRAFGARYRTGCAEARVQRPSRTSIARAARWRSAAGIRAATSCNCSTRVETLLAQHARWCASSPTWGRHGAARDDLRRRATPLQLQGGDSTSPVGEVGAVVRSRERDTTASLRLRRRHPRVSSTESD